MTKCPIPDITQAVPSPLDRARNSTSNYYSPREPLEYIAPALAVPYDRVTLVGRRELAALYVITTWSMRASEYLSATTDDLLGRDRLLIRGKKRSQNYMILLPGVDAQLAPSGISRPGRLVAGTTYQRVFRACVRLMYGSVQAGHINQSRTHAGRYIMAHQLMRTDSQAVSDLLHHRSRTSAHYYTGATGGTHGNYQSWNPVESFRESCGGRRRELEKYGLFAGVRDPCEPEHGPAKGPASANARSSSVFKVVGRSNI